MNRPLVAVILIFVFLLLVASGLLLYTASELSAPDLPFYGTQVHQSNAGVFGDAFKVVLGAVVGALSAAAAQATKASQ